MSSINQYIKHDAFTKVLEPERSGQVWDVRKGVSSNTLFGNKGLHTTFALGVRSFNIKRERVEREACSLDTIKMHIFSI